MCCSVCFVLGRDGNYLLISPLCVALNHCPEALCSVAEEPSVGVRVRVKVGGVWVR